MYDPEDAKFGDPDPIKKEKLIKAMKEAMQLQQVQSTVTHKKEPGIESTVQEVNSIRLTIEKPMETCSVTGEPGTEISIREYSDEPCMKITRIPSALDFPIIKKKKPRMKVKKFDWGGRR